ncbi:MAG: site-specific integrase [Hoeflea sp.]|jgi:integrase|uniref:tyrosine-type recombinase/integrase n=1 Tax=Hoeflea sp. TaxID=1940281 RepID=UPI0032ECBC97
MASKREIETKSGTTTVWVSYYTNSEGKRTSRSFKTKAKALAFEKVHAKAPKKPRQRIAKGHEAFQDIVDLYVDDSIIGRDGGEPWRANTLKAAQQRIKVIYRYIDPATPLRVIDLSFMKDIRRRLQTSEIARSTQTAIWSLVRSIFNYAVMEEVIATDPTYGLRIRRKRTHDAGEEKVEAYTKEEAQLLVRAAWELSTADHGSTRRSFEANWILAPLLFETGVRISEALALEWNSIDLDEGVIHIRQALSKNEGEIQSVKATASHRTLVISTALCGNLETFKAKEMRFLFETSTGEPQDYRNMLRWWHSLQRRIGMVPGGFHKARHYYASRLIEAGVDAKVLTTNLGHSDVAFTLQVYGHLFDDRDTRARKRELAEELSTLSF